MSRLWLRLSPPANRTAIVRTLLLEVHPVARSVVDPQLRNPFAHRPDVSRVSGGQPLDADQHAGSGPGVPQAVKPLGVDLRLADLDHPRNVSRRLHDVNPRPSSAAQTNSLSAFTLAIGRGRVRVSRHLGPNGPKRAYMDILKDIQRRHEVLTPVVY